MLRTRAGRAVVWVLPALLSVACGGKVVESVFGSGVDASLDDVIAFAETETKSCGFPGGAVAVIHNGTMTGYAAFGLRDDSGHLMAPDTLFLTAGVSKPMVGAAALALVEQQKLSLAAPITKVVPLALGSGFDASTVTLQELLTDTSGLPDLSVETLTCATGPGALASWFADNDSEPLWTPPGQVWDYSQRGYAVAGWAIGTAWGGAFEDAMSALVFNPAGMTTATYDPATVLLGNYATGHHVHDNGNVTTYQPGQVDCAASRPSDGVYASVLDEGHFLETLYAHGGSMLPESSVTELVTGQVNDEVYPGDKYAYGYYADETYKGLGVVRASGNSQGYTASVWMVPSARFGVIVLFNGYHGSAACNTDTVAAYALDTYFALTNVAAPDWSTPPATWSDFVGNYNDPYDLGAIAVTASGNSLIATSDAYGPVTLSQLSASAFTGEFGNNSETVTFYPDDSGAPAWFVTRLGVGKRQ